MWHGLCQVVRPTTRRSLLDVMPSPCRIWLFFAVEALVAAQVWCSADGAVMLAASIHSWHAAVVGCRQDRFNPSLVLWIGGSLTYHLPWCMHASGKTWTRKEERLWDLPGRKVTAAAAFRQKDFFSGNMFVRQMLLSFSTISSWRNWWSTTFVGKSHITRTLDVSLCSAVKGLTICACFGFPLFQLKELIFVRWSDIAHALLLDNIKVVLLRRDLNIRRHSSAKFLRSSVVADFTRRRGNNS